MNDMPSILQEIVTHKHQEVARRAARCSLAALEQQLKTVKAPRGFTDALCNRVMSGRNAVIAEIKKASPSAGVIREQFDPAQIASQYQKARATCLSVLTDERYFQGHDDYLQQAKQTCDLPILRKDFTVDIYQIAEARVLGADAILLIAAVLDDAHLAEFATYANDLDLDVLIEVHNEIELERALKLDQKLIGINNRDLHQFVTELSTSERLVKLMPEDRLVIAESGIHSHQHIQRMNDCGINSFLVGEALMRQPDPGIALTELLTA